MFKIVFILLLKITLAMLPYDNYGGYFISDNIMKLLGGRTLPGAVTNPIRTYFFEDDEAANTQANIQAAIPATEGHIYIGATQPTKHFVSPRAERDSRQKVDEHHRIEDLYRWRPNRQAGSMDIGGRDIAVAREDAEDPNEIDRDEPPANPATNPPTDPATNPATNPAIEPAGESTKTTAPTVGTRATTSTTTRRTRTTTTVSTTPTPVCTDDMGYRIRCTNATTRTTTTLRSRRRKTKPTKRTRKSRRTTTTLTTTTWFTTTTVTTDPNATTLNMTTLNTTTMTTTEPITTVTTTTEAETTETTMTTKRTRRLPWSRRSTVREPNDIDRILMILDNLTYIYETDVVDRLNETLELEGYPYCPKVRTRVTTTTTPKSWPISENTGKTIAKCFVCGMDVPGIPQESQCADAFAPDYMPGASLVYPPTHITRYKKHCKYLDMPTWHVNGTDGMSMWGQWDGGCSVRWVDLSGVYTQRSCRARHKPAIGRHLVSKRLAKMEYALNMLDNGCIGSAQASLVPFSRGISLYARFYACVCSKSYCNAARRLRTSLWYTVGVAITVLR